MIVMVIIIEAGSISGIGGRYRMEGKTSLDAYFKALFIKVKRRAEIPNLSSCGKVKKIKLKKQGK
jgi:hypothetical protein